jgi:hypothetical protein
MKTARQEPAARHWPRARAVTCWLVLALFAAFGCLSAEAPEETEALPLVGAQQAKSEEYPHAPPFEPPSLDELEAEFAAPAEPAPEMPRGDKGEMWPERANGALFAERPAAPPPPPPAPGAMPRPRPSASLRLADDFDGDWAEDSGAGQGHAGLGGGETTGYGRGSMGVRGATRAPALRVVAGAEEAAQQRLRRKAEIDLSAIGTVSATARDAEEDDRAEEIADGLLDATGNEEQQRAERRRGGSPAGGRAQPTSAVDLRQEPRPTHFLPRMFYFENTYLGGNAAHAEVIRRLDQALAQGPRPYRRAELPPQVIDPPESAGLALEASLNRASFDGPGRAILQVALRGSERYGWRRPPLDVALVIDGAALRDSGEEVVETIVELLRRLGPQDRMGVLVAGATPIPVAPLERLRRLRTTLPMRLETLPVPGTSDAAGLGAALQEAGSWLATAADDASGLPGTQTVLLLTDSSEPAKVAAATASAHALNVRGVVTSVIALAAGQEDAGWWHVANAGHGNFHRVSAALTPAGAVNAEIQSLARVVARLLRLNVRLGPGAQAIRVLGSRVLDEEEVRQVKEREVATDRHLSRTLGISADRGEDDDGLQTVIPYFYGGDAHVILIELWLDDPGIVADVTLRYKDMVNLRNSTAHAAVAVRRGPRPRTPFELVVDRNARGFEVGAALERAGHRVRHGDQAGALHHIDHAWRLAENAEQSDRLMAREFRQLVAKSNWQSSPQAREALAQALLTAGRRRVGHPR